MKSFKVVEKLMLRDDAPESWSLDQNINVKGKVVPFGTIGDVKIGYKYAHFCPRDRSLPKISWDSTKRSRLPITPIAPITEPITPPITTDRQPIICCDCGRHCSQPGESFADLERRTPWWDLSALYRPDVVAPKHKPRQIPAPENFAPIEIIADGDLAHICGECDRRRAKAERAREKAEKQAQETGRKQLALFEV
jgi:hypothetical protein